MPKHNEIRHADRRKVRKEVERALKARKKIRGVRAEIHEAMEAALAMKRSKKRGTGDVDDNMAKKGFKRVGGNVSEDTAEKGVPVEQKFRRIA